MDPFWREWLKHLRQQMDLRVKSSSLRKDQTSETLKTKLTSLSAQRIEFNKALHRTAAALGRRTVREMCQRLLQPTGRFRRRSLSLIVGETDRLNQSVTQLLSFARRESPAEQPLVTSELIRSVIDLFRANAREHGVDLEFEVRTDPQLSGKCASVLRDALSNLLSNALQATSGGGKVTLTAIVDQQELSISVKDTGPGIPADLREQIWEPFFTTRQRGTGLGLAIVRKRMQEVSGSASLGALQNGRGALFILRVPIDIAS